MGTATLTEVSEKEISFTVELGAMPESLHPLTLIAGFVRPNSVKRILRDATSLGVERIIWTPTELTEKSYRNSHIWDPSYQSHFFLKELSKPAQVLFLKSSSVKASKKLWLMVTSMKV